MSFPGSNYLSETSAENSDVVSQRVSPDISVGLFSSKFNEYGLYENRPKLSPSMELATSNYMCLARSNPKAARAIALIAIRPQKVAPKQQTPSV